LLLMEVIHDARLIAYQDAMFIPRIIACGVSYRCRWLL
jgi:hypothetical protein